MNSYTIYHAHGYHYFCHIETEKEFLKTVKFYKLFKISGEELWRNARGDIYAWKEKDGERIRND